jgi:hypothetical protein
MPLRGSAPVCPDGKKVTKCLDGKKDTKGRKRIERGGKK